MSTSQAIESTLMHTAKKFLKNLFTANTQTLNVLAVSKKGRRSENQDNFLIIRTDMNGGQARYLKNQKPLDTRMKDWPPTHARLAATDGMGGHAFGREMAEAVVEKLLTVPPCSTPAEMRTAVISLHQTLADLFPAKGDKSPGSTLVMADICLRSRQAVLLNIGDSRAFLLRGEKRRQLTHDHHAAEFAWRDGELERDNYEMQLNAGARRLVQAVGYGSVGIVKDVDGHKPFRFVQSIRLDLKEDLPDALDAHADVFTFQLRTGDLLLLATDGLWSAAPDALWPVTWSSDLNHQQGIENLADTVLESGANDNITIVLGGFELTSGEAV